MKTAAVLLAFLAAGCSGLPSFQYCNEVTYQRTGNQVKIDARCQLPIGGL